MFRILRFLSVGAVATLIDISLYFILVQYATLSAAIAGSISFCISAFINFTLNNSLTFASTKPFIKKLRQFYLIAIGGVFINYFLLSLLTQLGIQFIIAKLFVVGIVAMYNYVLHSQITFSETK